MAIVKTLDEFNTQSELAVNATNFPAAIEVFLFEEAVGATTITGSIQSSTVTLAAAVAAGTGSGKDVRLNSNTTVTGATFPTLGGGRTYVAIYVGNDDAAVGPIWGNTTAGPNIRTAIADYYESAVAKGQTAWGTASDSQTCVRLLEIDTATDIIYAYEKTASGGYNAVAGVDFTVNTPAYGAMTAALSMNPTGTMGDIYMIGLFEFDQRPGDLPVVCNWLYDTVVTAGVKALPPMWRYRT